MAEFAINMIPESSFFSDIYERTLRSGPEVSFTTEKGNFEIDHRVL